MQDHIDNVDNGALKISAAARLSGVSVHTLRKWEQRYGAVSPQRTEGGERVYSRLDVERLGLLKRLADAGVSLRNVAQLPADELAKAWSELGNTAAEMRGPVSRLKTAVFGAGVAATLSRQSKRDSALDVVATAATPLDLSAELDGAPVDVLLFECPTVQRDTQSVVSDLMTRIGASAAIVIYRFASRGDLLGLQAPNMATLRAPADATVLSQAAVGLLHPGAQNGKREQTDLATFDAPPPRFSREVVARVATASPQIHCECPHHLAELVLSLRAFEDYSAQCEDRNPADAALHRYLWRSAGQARALFEEAMERVADAEGIELDQ